MARKRNRKPRLTKREKQILEKQQQEEEERKKLLAERITIHEKVEVEYLKLEKRFKETFKKIQHYTSAIRGDYLDKDQKQKMLQELHNECKREREIARKIYGLHFKFLEKIDGN